MNQFVTKEILNLRSVGDILKTRRTTLGKELKDAERDLGIGFQYLEALEMDQFDRLPGSLYAKQFILKYCEWLGIDSVAELLFERIKHLFPEPKLVKRVSLKELMVFSRIVRYGVVSSLAITLLLIAFAQLYTFIAPPQLDITSHVEFTNHRLISIAGSVAHARTVVVNHEEIPVDDRGYFNAEVPLIEGINTMTVVATGGRGQTTERQTMVYYTREHREQQLSSR